MLQRRFITVPGYVIAWGLCLATAPLWIPLALVLDIVRRSHGVALRCAALVTVYLTCEVLGVAASAALWLWRRVLRPDEERWTDLHFRLESWWGTTLFRAVVWIFGLRLEIEGDADLGRGPYLLLLRHASMGDALLAAALVSGPNAFRLRYVLKRELLWDPCLDIVGNRLPNVFLDRASDDPARELQALQELARGLGPRDGVLIYPEGTRFSEAKRARVLEHVRRSGDEEMLSYASALSRVLPPRPGGTLALLEAAPEADVVFCAHTGFEAAGSPAEIWQGGLLHRTIRVAFRRVPRAEIPAERDARIAWMLEEWRRVGEWVEERPPRA